MRNNVIIYTAFVICAVTKALAAQQNTMLRSYQFEAPSIVEQADNTCRLKMRNTRPDDIPALPSMPMYSVSMEIPADHSVDTVTLSKSPALAIALNSPVTHTQPFLIPGEEPRFVAPDPQIYTADSDYPADHRLSWRTDPTSGKTLLSIIFTPLQYNPVRNTLLRYETITLCISLSEKPATAAPLLRAFSSQPALLDPQSRCDYLIITTSNLIENAVAPWDFDALLAQRERSGFIVDILPVERIYANYTGVDDPARIRHFLQDAHRRWNLKYLLIAGTHAMIPTRHLYIKVSAILNDHIAEIPADHIYYGCMGGSYDGNNNGRYGEYNDGDGGGDVDLTAEILVGRFPVENAAELAHMIRKTLQYESAPREEFFNNGFIAERVDFGNIVYGTPFMEEIRNGSATYGHNTLGYTTSEYAADFKTSNNLYDNSGYLFQGSDALDYFTNRLHSINHLGHGSYFQCFKLNSSREPDRSAIAALNNPFPWFVYSQACSSGAFDKENCFAEHFVTVSNAAVAAVMNSRQGWASPSGVYGPSQAFHRHYWSSAFRGNATTFGAMNEAARRANLSSVPSFNASLWRWVYYGLNLFGDPALPVMPAILNVAPAFNHTPLLNTYNTNSNYLTTCDLEPIGIYDPDSPFAVWSSSSTQGAMTQRLTRLPGNSYQLTIPPQPNPSRIDYYICASNHAGCASAEPALDTHTFRVTDKLSLLVAGSPSNVGAVEPDYGLHASASGLVINVSAPDLTYESENMRYANKGFFGAGSVPTASTNLFASFQIDVDSILVWRWQREYRIRVNSNISLPAERVFWPEENSSFTPPAADLYLTDSMSNLFAFAEWQLDGARSPALPQKSIPQHPPISISSQHELTAIYIPATQDSDGNGIEDWWEYQYFGAPGQDIFADHDGDGYDLYQEFADHSDPLDPLIIPAPPHISHLPLSSPADHPGAFTVEAAITDTHAVTNALVRWRVNSNAWHITPLTLISNHLYTATIAAAATAGDWLRYSIEARDPSGNHAATPVHNVFLAYPVADYSLLEDVLVVTQPQSSVITNSSVIINRGNMPLEWSISCGLSETFPSDCTSDLLGWDTTSIEQSWSISTNQSHSPPYSMHARVQSTRGRAHYASITLPPLVLGTDATLSFAYWIDSEVDKRNPLRAFDGGILEYSTNGGATFQHLDGPYTHEIYGYSRSPWTNATPCFAGFNPVWRTARFDLAARYPQEIGFEGRTVLFRFVYGGDDNTDLEGWYVDDIRISPAALPSGFNYSLPALQPYTTAASSFSEILWRNLPGIMDSRTEQTTVFFDSNAPFNAADSILWRALIREEPRIHTFNVGQIANGRGDVNLSLSAEEIDNEKLDLKFEWSADRGHHWHAAALTNITLAPQHTNLPATALDGQIRSIPGTTNSVPITNSINAIWNSATPAAAIGYASNIYMRLRASSPWFIASATRIFPIDNIAPIFNPGNITATPQGKGGDYLVTDNHINLNWPPAIDTPATNPVLYSIFAGTNLLKTCTALTHTLISMTNHLDMTSTITVVPSDPLQNSGIPLKLTTLILNPDTDYDSDGATTAEEEIAGTDAADPSSVFIISAFSAATNALTISWSSVIHRNYSVETTPSLTTPLWSAVPGLQNIQGTAAVITRELPANGSNAFYRVRVFE